MKFEERVITPDDAIIWLEERAANRPVSDRVVKDYSRQMKEGWWQDTPQGIAFGVDGKLIDGQHRLWAIVEAKIPIKMNIVWDVPPQAFHIIDRGLPRSVAFITKVPTFATQCYTLLISLVQRENKPAPDDISLMHKLLSSYIQSLKDASSSRLRFFASAPIRSAALVALANGGHSKYILDNWSFISKATVNEAPPIIGAFYEAYNQGWLLPTRSAGSYLRKELYLRARYIFDVNNCNIKNIPRNFGDSLSKMYLNEVVDVVKRALGTHYRNHVKILPAQKLIQKELHKETINDRQVKQMARIIDAEQARLSMESRG